MIKCPIFVYSTTLRTLLYFHVILVHCPPDKHSLFSCGRELLNLQINLTSAALLEPLMCKEINSNEEYKVYLSTTSHWCTLYNDPPLLPCEPPG